MNTTEKAIQDKQDYKQTYLNGVKALIEIQNALQQWDNKIVDIRFFKKFFSEKNEYRDYEKYSISAPRYSFDTGYRIYLAKDCELKIENRETAHIKEKVSEQLTGYQARIDELTKDIETLTAFDEHALIKDLRALYTKHGKPETWGKILDSYEVKYPTSN